MKKIIVTFTLILMYQTHGQNSCNLPISAPPTGFNSFYTKYVTANGIPIVSSNQVPDNAFCIAYDAVRNMTANLPTAVINNMIANNAKLAIMGSTQVTTNIPEHSTLPTLYPNTNWNSFRGIGGTLFIPTASCAEENLLCYANDPYLGESITVHEFAHSIHNLGLATTFSNFNQNLQAIYDAAIVQGKWQNTYAATNATEYFAEGVQSFFNTNLEAIPANGIHNYVNTKSELQAYDPSLYNLIATYFGGNWSPTCNPANVVVLSNESFDHQKSLALFPNPAQDFISIDTDLLIEKIEIYTTTGNLILSKKSPNKTIDVSFLNAGLYLVIVKTLEQSFQSKIIINK